MLKVPKEDKNDSTTQYNNFYSYQPLPKVEEDVYRDKNIYLLEKVHGHLRSALALWV